MGVGVGWMRRGGQRRAYDTGRGLWGGVTEGGTHGVRPREGSVGPGPLQGGVGWWGWPREFSAMGEKPGSTEAPSAPSCCTKWFRVSLSPHARPLV